MKTPLERMMAKVRVESNGCWIWTGSKGTKGGGTIRVDGKVTSPRRLSYYLFIGPIPEGRQVNPSCGNKLCINPDHLVVSERKRRTEKIQKSVLPFDSNDLKKNWVPDDYDKQALERLMDKIRVDDDSGCWIWTGAVGGSGYGNAYHKGKYVNSHKLAYQLQLGPIPEGRNVCHTCDNKLCLNPGHLFLGTQKKNLDDMRFKGRCSRGESHSEAIKRGWTPEVRKQHSERIKEIRKREHIAKAKASGTPNHFKYCPDCKQWFPRTDTYWYLSPSRKDGLSSICIECKKKNKQKK